MHKSQLNVLWLLLIIGLAACSNTLNVQAPYKNITVVYGLLDQNDTAHYIRVNRAYEGVGNAITIASQFDSVYYPADQVTVQLQELNTGKLITLIPDSSIPLSPGTFPYPKQILYKTKYILNVNFTYNLIVTGSHIPQPVTGSTSLLSDVTFTTNIGPYFPFSFSTLYPSTFQWFSGINNGIYQMTFRFYYAESSTSGTVEKYVDWVFPSQNSQAVGTSEQYDYDGEEFLQFVAISIPVEPGVTRHADSLSLLFSSGSQDLNTYVQLSQSSLGIDPDPPSFSDVTNGVGIFTSRHKQVITRPMAGTPIADSLIYSSQTSQLNFQ